MKAALQEAGIGSMVYYSAPVHRQPPYAHLEASCPVAEDACNEVLSLPMWPGMGKERAERVAEAVRTSL